MRAKFHAIAAVVKGSDRRVTSTPSAFVADDAAARRQKSERQQRKKRGAYGKNDSHDAPDDAEMARIG